MKSQVNPLIKEKLINLFNTELISNIKTGQTFSHFKKQVSAKMYELNLRLDDYPDENEDDKNALSTENLEKIFLTFGAFYYGTQRYVSMVQNAESRPYWQYTDIINENTSTFCRSLIDKVFLFNNPFWDKFYPPNHPGCMALVRALNANEVESRHLQLLNDLNIVHPFPEWAFNPSKIDWKLFFNDFIIKTFDL